jgi:hypothetical protein
MIHILAAHAAAHHAQANPVMGFLFLAAIVVVVLCALHTVASKIFGRRSS